MMHCGRLNHPTVYKRGQNLQPSTVYSSKMQHTHEHSSNINPKTLYMITKLSFPEIKGLNTFSTTALEMLFPVTLLLSFTTQLHRLFP